MSPPITPPKGFAIGDRIVTNAIYTRIYARSPRRRGGTIVAGSHSNEGTVKILLDGCKYAVALSPKLFDLVKS